MLELISHIVLGYYLVMGVILLIFVAWGYIDDRGYEKRRRRETRSGDDTGTQPGSAERDPGRQANQDGSRSDNVVNFKRGK